LVVRDMEREDIDFISTTLQLYDHITRYIVF
jgi:hypothetical protein